MRISDVMPITRIVSNFSKNYTKGAAPSLLFPFCLLPISMLRIKILVGDDISPEA